MFMGFMKQQTSTNCGGLTIRSAPFFFAIFVERYAGLVQRRPRQGGGPLESWGAPLRPLGVTRWWTEHGGRKPIFFLGLMGNKWGNNGMK